MKNLVYVRNNADGLKYLGTFFFLKHYNRPDQCFHFVLLKKNAGIEKKNCLLLEQISKNTHEGYKDVRFFVFLH